MFVPYSDCSSIAFDPIARPIVASLLSRLTGRPLPLDGQPIDLRLLPLTRRGRVIRLGLVIARRHLRAQSASASYAPLRQASRAAGHLRARRIAILRKSQLSDPRAALRAWRAALPDLHGAALVAELQAIAAEAAGRRGIAAVRARIERLQAAVSGQRHTALRRLTRLLRATGPIPMVRVSSAQARGAAKKYSYWGAVRYELRLGRGGIPTVVATERAFSDRRSRRLAERDADELAARTSAIRWDGIGAISAHEANAVLAAIAERLAEAA